MDSSYIYFKKDKPMGKVWDSIWKESSILLSEGMYTYTQYATTQADPLPSKGVIPARRKRRKKDATTQLT